MKKLIWLIGEDASAARLHNQKHWSMFRNEDLPERDPSLIDERAQMRSLSVGVLFLLQHPKMALREDPSMYFQNKLMSKKSYSPNTVIFTAIFIALTLVSLWSLFMVEDFNRIEQAKFNWPSLIVFVGGFWIAQSFMSWLEAKLLLTRIHGDRRILHTTIFGYETNPIAWSLCNFWKEALVLFALNAGLILCAWRIVPHHLYQGLGMLLGFAFWLAFALLPLKPGPIDSFLKHILNIEESPYQLLKWSIEGKMLPAGQRVEANSSWSLTFLSLILLAWVFALLSFLKYVKLQLPESYYANAIFLEMFISFAGAAICLFFMLSIFTFYKRAWRFNKGGKIEEFTPTTEETDHWQMNSALLYHIPILRESHWKWQRVEEGTWLIKKGEQTRRFYWIQQGEVKVFGRRAGEKDLKLLSKLHSGSGFGELALLDNTARNADIFVSKDSILAYLDVDEFEKVSNDFYRKHFRRIVQASQLFETLEMFKNIPSKNREEWMSRALLLDMNRGDVIIEAGGQDQWMGLLLEGEIKVMRDGVEVARLQRGQIFGEMSYITDLPRAATLIASDDCVLFRWESGWWASQAEMLGLRPYFEGLILSRKEID